VATSWGCAPPGPCTGGTEATGDGGTLLTEFNGRALPWALPCPWPFWLTLLLRALLLIPLKFSDVTLPVKGLEELTWKFGKKYGYYIFKILKGELCSHWIKGGLISESFSILQKMCQITILNLKLWNFETAPNLAT
jgi:hypothetical protein